MKTRMRRLRKSPAIRAMLTETTISSNDFILPIFVCPGSNKREPISAMPGQYRYSVDMLSGVCESMLECGVHGVLIFGLTEKKDECGSQAWAEDATTQQAVRYIKEHYPQLCVMTDLCLCPFTTHGHCGVIKDGSVDNDATLPLLEKAALAQAQAGSDFIAPSDMMDGRIKVIRQALESNGFHETGILSYSTKFASAYYGPFREAASSAPEFGDRKSYQQNPANAREALRESLQDIEEGADMLMVKPALAFLDIIKTVRDNTLLPLVCYNVSGEYSMVKAAAAQGWLNERDVVLENLSAMKRAGSDLIITYHALDAAGWLSGK